MLYSLQDITLIPATISEVSSRSECNPYYTNKKLPLFVAPMSQILDENNWKTYDKYVNTIIPRNISIECRLELAIDTFIAVSLDEFKTYFIDASEEEFEILSKVQRYVCIDVANGHMKKLLDYCTVAKEKWNDKLILMAGNVANPITYLEYAEAGVDYIRISIGSGSQCTTANTGIYYPMASLIKEICKMKSEVIRDKGRWNKYKSIPKIVADGGFNTYGDIIKALAIGADYVMCGKIFAKCEEACGQIIPSVDGSCYREYYGMSTKRAQKEFGKEGNKTEEGIGSIIPVEYTLKDWITEFTDYLKSSMSYTNHRSIDSFIGGVRYEYLSSTAIRRFK